jgi:protein CpxP
MRTWILAATMMMGVSMAAQAPADKPQAHTRHEKMQREHLTPQQRAELKSKQLTLKLDLSDKQQKDVEKLLLGAETKKEATIAKRIEAKNAGVKPTQEERLAMRNAMLDDRIAMKRDLKKILSAEQYFKFEKLQEERAQKHLKQQKRGQFAKRR